MINFLPQNNFRRKKTFFILAIILFFLVFYFFYNLNAVNSKNNQVVDFIVEPGQGSVIIANRLKAAGLIRSAVIFELYVWQQGISSHLLDGHYALAKNLDIIQVAKILSQGAVINSKEQSLTFIEGWTNQQYANYLVKQGFANQLADFLSLTQHKANWWDNYSVLVSRPKNLDLEGYLFPDTYRFFNNATLTEIVEKILANTEIKIKPDWRAEIGRQKKTIHEILTLAAILEKEVSSSTDRKLVADIFYKRLAVGMALQADSTVNYATGQSDTSVSIKDLQIDSPYNTYKYKGLPPGPICNPGLSAIEAAIYPKTNSYWYFLTTSDGRVIYSKTHAEHVAAKAKYLK